MSKIPIVDEEDNIIAYKERAEILPSDIYRVASLWIFNSKGEVLLTQRALTKPHDPGKWASAVAGVVEEGETYESNIIKEMQEELGLKNLQVETFFKNRVIVQLNFFCQVFKLIVDLPIESLVLQKEEVKEARWFNLAELVQLLETNPSMFVGSFGEHFAEVLKHLQKL